MKLVVVGGGIMGLCCAEAAARRGHEVDLVEQGPLPNPVASSWDHSRLIRYTYGPKHGYARLVRAAYTANAALLPDLGDDLYAETGTLVLVRGEDPFAAASRQSLERLGIAHDVLSADVVAARFPVLVTAGLAWGLWTPTGGVLRAKAMLEALVTRLDARPNVRLHGQRRVVEADPTGRVRCADGSELRSDRVLVTAGPWVADLFPDLAPVAQPSRQIALDIALDDEARARWAGMPMVLDGVASAGSGFYAVPPVLGLDLKIGDHSFSLTGHPDRDREPSAGERARIVALAAEGLREGPLAVRAARSCFYTVAPEERFIVRPDGARLVLTGFSGHGFKFGALVGALVAEWLGGAMRTDDLAHALAGEATFEVPAH